jgi:hypothetical protein
MDLLLIVEKLEDYDRMKREYEELKQLKEESMRDSQRLKERVRSKDAEIDQLKENLLAGTGMWDALKASLDEVVGERDVLTRKIGKLEEAVSKETRERKGLEVKLPEFEKSIKGFKEQVNSLGNELACCREDLARLESEKVMVGNKEITLKQLDERIIQTYNEQIEQRAQERLEVLKSEEWPAWHTKHHGEQVKLNAQNMVNELARKHLWEGMFKALNDVVVSKQPFRVSCDKCQRPLNDITIMLIDVEALMRTGEAWVECPNPGCIDEPFFDPFKIFRSKKHMIKVTLVEFLRQL